MVSSRWWSFLESVAVVQTSQGLLRGDISFDRGPKKVSASIWILGRKDAPCFADRCASSSVMDRRVRLRLAHLRRALRMPVCVARKWGEANKYTVRDVSAGMARRYSIRRSRKCPQDDAYSSRLCALTGPNAEDAHVNFDIWSAVKTSSG